MGKPRKKKLPENLATLIVEKKADTPEGRVNQLKRLFQHHNTVLEKRRRWAEEFHKRYEKTKNPLAVWDCYIHSREVNEPIPDFVLDYFDRVSKSLLDENNNIESLGRCLEFNTVKRRGGHGDFRQYADYLEKRQAVFEVYQLMESEPELTVEQACEKVIQNFKHLMISVDTLKKWKSTIQW